MDSTWSNPDFLQQSSDEYLASLQNFLDGQDSSFTTSSFDPNASLTAFAKTLQTGSSGGGAFASPGKPNNSTFDALSAFGGNNGLPSASDIQINPSLLGSLPGYNHGLTGINTANEPSSPELTSASSSADSPASSADAPAPSTHHHQQQTGTRGSTRRVVSGGSTSAAGSGAGVGHDKRKAPQQGSGAVKDRKSVGGAGASGSTHHSHPTGEDDELERSESPELPAGKGAKGKTSERRRAQNRQAQRNFRERKEKHLKDLETRVLDLESKTQTQESENSALKAVLEQLRSENARLRVFETAFTFNYNKDVDGSAAMPQAQVFGGPAGAAAALPAGLAGPGARPLPQHQPRSTGSQLSSPSSVGAGADKPPTPPTAQDELDDVTAAFKFDTSSLGFGLTSGTGATPANAFASPLPSPPSASTSNPSSAAAHQQTADDLFASFTLPSPPSLSSSSSAAAPSISSTLPSTSSASSPYPTAQFTAYRDPLPALLGSTTAAQPGLTTFADFDALFGVGAPAGPAATAGVGAEDPLAAFLSSTGNLSSGSATSSAAPSPSATLPLGASPSMFPSSHLAPSPGAGLGVGMGLGQGETAVCGMIKEAQAQARKRGEKFEFDLDGLCSEMKLKATCQEAARQALKSAMAEDAAASRMTYPGRQI